eukprot:scaffold5444_cov157-Amphora_coffeaeformis.AAC.1
MEHSAIKIIRYGSSSSSDRERRVTAVYKNQPCLSPRLQQGQVSPPSSCFVIPSLSFNSEGLSTAKTSIDFRDILALPSFEEEDEYAEDSEAERMGLLSMRSRSSRWSVLASRFLSKLDREKKMNELASEATHLYYLDSSS